MISISDMDVQFWQYVRTISGPTLLPTDPLQKIQGTAGQTELPQIASGLVRVGVHCTQREWNGLAAVCDQFMSGRVVMKTLVTVLLLAGAKCASQDSNHICRLIVHSLTLLVERLVEHTTLVAHTLNTRQEKDSQKSSLPSQSEGDKDLLQRPISLDKTVESDEQMKDSTTQTDVLQQQHTPVKSSDETLGTEVLSSAHMNPLGLISVKQTHEASHEHPLPCAQPNPSQNAQTSDTTQLDNTAALNEMAKADKTSHVADAAHSCGNTRTTAGESDELSHSIGRPSQVGAMTSASQADHTRGMRTGPSIVPVDDLVYLVGAVCFVLQSLESPTSLELVFRFALKLLKTTLACIRTEKPSQSLSNVPGQRGTSTPHGAQLTPRIEQHSASTAEQARSEPRAQLDYLGRMEKAVGSVTDRQHRAVLSGLLQRHSDGGPRAKAPQTRAKKGKGKPRPQRLPGSVNSARSAKLSPFKIKT
ncbi:hypothetical protein SARC_03854 [Sphaeroforma arctica JP610]|uniref:Uncharacterized protein n=1 Tax=Sphaeroforma arctica JP610 TaxID=667725 RepID=A0A0L0G4T0_9EUKA|nr:hypothetical protein SARC_03854 [Sphaeroforma arctica JP610]KNC83919.1 hypothetical protein SARC_03854 [Sphaeroforma arctica JP610]|eukprot:XP_014157821.1 hypothetical protein SARC_03854 [Sphaeroforma arctica JP610]